MAHLEIKIYTRQWLAFAVFILGHICKQCTWRYHQYIVIQNKYYKIITLIEPFYANITFVKKYADKALFVINVTNHQNG